MLTKAPVMTHYDINAPLTLITGARPTGLGAVLVQGKDDRPVMYISRSLADHERKYPQIEREGLCVVYAVTRLRQFLLGRKFTLITDNKPLSCILSA